LARALEGVSALPSTVAGASFPPDPGLSGCSSPVTPSCISTAFGPMRSGRAAAPHWADRVRYAPRQYHPQVCGGMRAGFAISLSVIIYQGEITSVICAARIGTRPGAHTERYGPGAVSVSPPREYIGCVGRRATICPGQRGVVLLVGEDPLVVAAYRDPCHRGVPKRPSRRSRGREG